MDWFNSLNVVLSVFGISLFIWALFRYRAIRILLPKAKIMRYWKICAVLIVFFIGAYIINIIALILNLDEIIHIFEALVYILGAVFVVGVLEITYLTYKIILEVSEEDQ